MSYLIAIIIKYFRPPYVLITLYVCILAFFAIRKLLNIITYHVLMHYTYTSDSVHKFHKEAKALRDEALFNIANAPEDSEKKAFYNKAQQEYNDLKKRLVPRVHNH